MVLSGAVIMMKYLEDSSPNVLVPLDLCIWITAMPSKIYTTYFGSTGSLGGVVIPSSTINVMTLFVVFLRLPS